MQLLFVYIHKYRSIERQGFTFTSRYSIDLTHDGENVTNIRISKNDNHIEQFFDHEKIQEVTAIVGENGAGKSTIMNYLRDLFLDLVPTNFTESPKTKDFYIILDDHNKRLFIQRAYKKLVFQDGTNLEILEFIDYFPARLNDPYLQNWFYAIIHNNTIAYNTVKNSHILRLEPNPIFNRTPAVFDISTEFLIQNNGAIYTNATEEPSNIDNYLLADLKRQVSLAFRFESANIPFDTPKELVCQLTDLQQEDSDGRFNNRLKEIFEIIQTKGSGIADFAHLLDLLTLQSFYNLYTSLTRREIHGYIDKQFMAFIDSVDYNQLQNKIPEAADFYSNLESDLIKKPFRKKQFVRDFPTHYAIMRQEFETLPLDSFNVKLDSLAILLDIKESNEEKVIQLISAIFNTIFPLNPLQIYWHNLSAGELSLMNFRARLFEASDNDTSKRTLLFLLDETDLNYHPEWQRTFLTDTLNFAAVLFPDNELQFIFTTNTPFIVADIPSEKVLHLKKVDGKTVVDTEEKVQSFASNIHTLLASNFYLSSFLGEFANKKIKGVIKDLTTEGKNLSEERRLNIKKLIQQVGEKVIQERLKQIYETSTGERFATETESEVQIELMRKRVAEYDAMKKRLEEKKDVDDQD